MSILRREYLRQRRERETGYARQIEEEQRLTREEHADRVEMLTRNRSAELQALDDEFREIMDEAGETTEGAAE